MFRQVICGAALAVLVSGLCLGDIEQDQGYAIDGRSAATLLRGHATIGDSKILTVMLGQTTFAECGLWAIQDDNAIFLQRTAGVGNCAILETLQVGQAVGQQSQSIGSLAGEKAQGQGLEVGLGQSASKIDAGALATRQGFVSHRPQTAGSPYGLLAEDQLVNLSQNSCLAGSAGSNGQAVTNSYLNTNQSQGYQPSPGGE